MPGWSDVVGPDYNQPLKPGPLEVGFDYFWGFPHVSQLPHIIIENHNVLGLSPEDPIEIVPDRRPEHRRDYLHRSRIGAANLRVKGGQSARYDHDELADMLTDKAVEYINGRSGDQPFFLYVAHRNIHGPLIPAERFQGASEFGPYGDFLAEFDGSVGRVLSALDQNGLRDNTLVLFGSDNGGVVKYEPIDYASVEGHFLSHRQVIVGQRSILNRTMNSLLHDTQSVRRSKVMRVQATIIVIGLTLCQTLAAPADEGKPWLSLFDGETLDGWKQLNGTATYQVVDGTIVGTTVEGSWNSFLCTEKQYGDFELEFDVRVHDRLNSGVQVRSKTRDKTIGKGPNLAVGRVIGPQVEIEASKDNGAEAGYAYPLGRNSSRLVTRNRNFENAAQAGVAYFELVNVAIY